MIVPVPISIVSDAIKSGVKKFEGIAITGEAKDLDWQGVSFRNSLFSNVNLAGSNEFSGLQFTRCVFSYIRVSPNSVINVFDMKSRYNKIGNVFLGRGTNLSCLNASVIGGGLFNLEARTADISVQDSSLDFFTMGNINTGKLNLEGTEFRHSFVDRKALSHLDNANALIRKVAFKGQGVVHIY